MILKKKRTIQKFDNVVVFPGTSEMLLRDAQYYAENYQYQLAIEKFETAFQLVEGDEHSLSVYAFSLYEVKEYEKAKAICEQLLAIGPNNYFDAMELYLTICMQLKQFEQVNKLIQSLLEEGIVPENRIEKFERLKHLNAEIAENKKFQNDKEYIEEESHFSAASFMDLTPQEQLVIVNEMTVQNIRPFSDEIKVVIEHEETHAFIKSLFLILLVEQEVAMELVVQKSNQKMVLKPNEYPLPTQLPMYQEIMGYINDHLEREPSIQELVHHLITKHAIVAYPFQWEPFEADQVASTYIDFVKMMFGEVVETNDECIEFLQHLELLSEI